METRGVGERMLLSLVSKDRLLAILDRMLNEDEFLSEYGIRSLSKYHKDHPYVRKSTEKNSPLLICQENQIQECLVVIRIGEDQFGSQLISY